MRKPQALKARLKHLDGFSALHSIQFMPQSLGHILAHVIFSTKDRTPWIDEKIEERLHAYIATLIRDLKCEAHRVGGVEDHVHLAVRLANTISLSDFVQKIKTGSSTWVKQQGEKYTGFYWQSGYGAFSISPRDLDAVVAYVANQKEHHQKCTFQEEYLKFLNKYQIAYDKRYIWT